MPLRHSPRRTLWCTFAWLMPMVLLHLVALVTSATARTKLHGTNDGCNLLCPMDCGRLVPHIMSVVYPDREVPTNITATITTANAFHPHPESPHYHICTL